MAEGRPQYTRRLAELRGLRRARAVAQQRPIHLARRGPGRSTHRGVPARQRPAVTPVLPLSPGRAERHGFEYVRHGTLSLDAALNTKTGTLFGDTVARRTSEAFVAFLAALVAQQPRLREVHIIADNTRRPTAAG
jgi:hypothetical protein